MSCMFDSVILVFETMQSVADFVTPPCVLTVCHKLRGRARGQHSQQKAPVLPFLSLPHSEREQMRTVR